MSSRSNYSLYAPYVKGAQTGPQSSRIPQEAEVDALTDLLVQSMDSSTQDSEIYGAYENCNFFFIKVNIDYLCFNHDP